MDIRSAFVQFATIDCRTQSITMLGLDGHPIAELSQSRCMKLRPIRSFRRRRGIVILGKAPSVVAAVSCDNTRSCDRIRAPMVLCTNIPSIARTESPFAKNTLSPRYCYSSSSPGSPTETALLDLFHLHTRLYLPFFLPLWTDPTKIQRATPSHIRRTPVDHH